MKKKCRTCHIPRDIEDFYAKRGACKFCVSDKMKAYYKQNSTSIKGKRLRYKFNITKEEYNKMLDSQDGKCAICRVPSGTQKRSLAVDHCHKNGKIRGLLCINCNQGIGHFKDRIDLLEAAIAFLQKHQ